MTSDIVRRADGLALCKGSPKQIESVEGEPGPIGSFGCGEWVAKPWWYGTDHAAGCCWNLPTSTRTGSGSQGV